MPAWVPEQAERSYYLDPVRAALGEEVWQHEHERGRRRSTLEHLLSL
jgi:hypothetical protein